jgi:hypothetical protein
MAKGLTIAAKDVTGKTSLNYIKFLTSLSLNKKGL